MNILVYFFAKICFLCHFNFIDDEAKIRFSRPLISQMWKIKRKLYYLLTLLLFYYLIFHSKRLDFPLILILHLKQNLDISFTLVLGLCSKLVFKFLTWNSIFHILILRSSYEFIFCDILILRFLEPGMCKQYLIFGIWSKHNSLYICFNIVLSLQNVFFCARLFLFFSLQNQVVLKAQTKSTSWLPSSALLCSTTLQQDMEKTHKSLLI